MHREEEQGQTKDRDSQVRHEWQMVVNFLRKAEPEQFLFIAKKMIYHLCWNGVRDAQELLQNLGTNQKLNPSEIAIQDENRPSPKISLDMLNIASKTFEIALRYLSDDEILSYIHTWIQENQSNFLVRALLSQHTSLAEIAEAIRRFHTIISDPDELPLYARKGMNVSIIRRFFSDQEEFIRIAKQYIDVKDIYEILQQMIFSGKSRGRLGGKSSGVILASHIIKRMQQKYQGLERVTVPKTWYISSDEVLYFRYYNSLEETGNQKYKPLEQVRLEYPHIIQIFKNSPFPPEILKGLSQALDDFGEVPLIVRSSSLLEDRLGTAFSGKYKSLFLANQGPKERRLDALTDAVAEVYASLYGPDPIEYRAERDLLDFHEEMGIMIQQVVGTRVGKYFLPAYAGVAFSQNEFRWSPRIRRSDGLIRLVPGLGTRAVDRVADDYPILIAPGQPNLRVNVTAQESIRYAPKKVDVMNLETNTFETIAFDELVKTYGKQLPELKNIVSVVSHEHLTRPHARTKFSEEFCVVTFEGLRTNTPFVEHIRTILTVLEEAIQTPVDIEFASDGQNLYLLQCRPQSQASGDEAAPIPRDIPSDKIIFSANKYVSNGTIPDITHVVYVDPLAYQAIEDRETLLNVGRAVGKLNAMLPKRKFILLGPGRWGSRGDLKLGVNITYSDINNTAALIEVAIKKGDYLPDLSFGTHFFQDLVEAAIRYLPLYPDSAGVVFQQDFFTRPPNALPDLAPEYASLHDVIKVIDVPKVTDGQVLRLAMNADLDEAMAYLHHGAHVM